jgi:hypothetical protein
LERNRAAVAETKKIGALNIQMLQQRSRIVGRLLEAERPILDIGRAPAALLLERNDPPTGGESR